MNAELAVGMEIGPLRQGPVTRMDLVRYAGASGDFNPIHILDESAREAGFEGVIAHGMLTMAHVGRMLTDFAGPGGDIVEFSIRFRAVVRPGDTLEISGTVTEVAPSGAGKFAALQVRATNGRGETVVKGVAKVRFDGPPATG